MNRKALRVPRIVGNTAFIPLSKGMEAIIDTNDLHLICNSNWCAQSAPHTAYAVCSVQTGGQRRRFFMHREIASPPKGFVIDHINGNGLDNRRSNLRIATCAENTHNQRLSIRSTSGVKGVTWHRTLSKWQAQITFGRTKKCLGVHDTIEGAQLAYAMASKELHGDFGRSR